MVKIPLTLDREICKDGFVFRVYEPTSNCPLANASEPQSKAASTDSVDSYETIHSGPAIYSSMLGHKERTYIPISRHEDKSAFERPASRRSYHRTGNYTNSRMPPLKVRRYPFILDGHQGLYTIAQISRYANIAPRRGTAMLLRRFRLVNEMLDRRHAVGYENRRILPQVDDGSKSNERQSRWHGHGASKLRNEISLEDLIDDEDSDVEFSFSEFVDRSFDSRYSYDFETPFKTQDFTDLGNHDFEHGYDAGLREILGLDTNFRMLDMSDDEDETETY
ncbi:hypothetical protein ACEPAI_6697 [Sanghuangporus weigelae]